MDERATARIHAPLARPTKAHPEPRMLCWDASCHCGCRFTAELCQQDHTPITTLQGLHKTVCMQIAKRGGLKNQPLVDDLAKVNKLNTKYRNQLAAEAAAHKAPPKGLTRIKTKFGKFI